MKGIPDFPLHDIQGLKKLTCVIFPHKKREEIHKSRLRMFNYFKSYKASLVLYIHIHCKYIAKYGHNGPKNCKFRTFFLIYRTKTNRTLQIFRT